MDKLVLVLLFLAAMLLGQRLFIRLLQKTLNSAAAEGISLEKPGENEAENWERSGSKRQLQNAEMPLGTEDFFENEKTELQDLEEALVGLSEEEADEIIKAAGISGGEEEETLE